MTAMDIDDLVVVTGPLTHDGDFGWVYLVLGEVAQVVQESAPELPTTIRVRGLQSGNLNWIDITSLTPLSEIYNRSDVQWGDPEDPDYVVLDGGAVDAEASPNGLAAWSDEDQAMWGDLLDIDLSLPLNIEDVFGPDDDLPIDVIHDYVHERVRVTIIVVTTEHGDRSFEATEWDVVDGRLWVGTDDVGVAEFAIGSWQFVYETDNPQPEPEPRVWLSSADIPEGVIATDTDGDYWKVVNGHRYLSCGSVDNWGGSMGPTSRSDDRSYGPFTEYLESE